MKTHEMTQSKYLKKEDCGDDGILATIAGVKQEDVGTETEPDVKWTLRFQEAHLKPMVLNSTNLQLIEKALNSDETDDWRGKAIVLFHDPNVSFGGKLTGGIRVDVNRTKRYHAKQEKAPAVPERTKADPAGKFDDFVDDVPFN